jgi:hypothetical protein
LLALGTLGAFKGFVDADLIPHLKGLRERPNSTPRQKVISEIFSGVERTRIDTERNLLDVLDKVHEISAENVDTTHVFTVPDCQGAVGTLAGSPGLFLGSAAFLSNPRSFIYQQ